VVDTHRGLPHDRRLAALVGDMGDEEYDNFQVHELQGEWPEAFDLYQARLTVGGRAVVPPHAPHPALRGNFFKGSRGSHMTPAHPLPDPGHPVRTQ
jgi:hypothetical protein